MKFKNFLFLITIVTITFSACKKDGEGDDGSDLLGENGLPKPVNNIVSADLLNEIKSLGMTVNTGENPPSLAGTFLASPFELKGTNVPDDWPIGSAFADYYATLSNQNNANLSITLSYTSADESGSGIGSYISGSGNSFTVFAKTNSTIGSSSAELIQIISGTLTDGGISNFYYANFMLNNNGDGDIWLENGEGRVLYDSDGFSEKTSNMKTIEITKLPSTGSK